jgi:transcriptional regulator with XRE-family HTH domain
MKSTILLPSAQKVLQVLGENIKLARLRRKLNAEQVAERANIGRKTLWAIENGSASVAMGSYVQVLFVLNQEKDLLKVAEDDLLGRKLQDLKLVVKKRAPKRNSTTTISINKSLKKSKKK